jgi:hypothetical protein
MTISKRQASADSGPERDPFDTLYRDLVAIHAAIAERTNSDPSIMPWAMRELRGVLDSIQKRKAGQPLATAETRMLDIVHDRLDMIHDAIEARTDGDRDIVPWTGRNIMGLIREIDAFRLGASR